jgi:ABC-2 family transporter protein
MLWQKSWWETRWLFLIYLIAMFWGYILMLMFGVGYKAAEWAARLHQDAFLSESERQALNSYQGHTWMVFIKLLFNFGWANLAVMMGAACLATVCPLAPYQRASVFFTFSLPVNRRKVLLSHAAVGYSEIFMVALIPFLFLPLIARLQGAWFSWKDAMLYALLMIFGGAIFFFFSFLLTVILGNWLVAFAIVEAVLMALIISSLRFGTRPWWNIFGMMAGESYFYHGRIPWPGLAISLAVSALMIFAAVRIFERRDF